MQTISMGIAAVKILEIELCFIETSLRSGVSCVVCGTRWIGSELRTTALHRQMNCPALLSGSLLLDLSNAELI